MRQGDFFRILALFSMASAGAGLALLAASLTGHLGASTTVEEFVSVPASPTTPTSTDGDLSVQQIYQLDAPGVVEISAIAPSSRGRRSGGSVAVATIRPLGSGFVIDKTGHILTTRDVIGGARSVAVSFSGGDELSARVIGVDPATDIAVLQINAHSSALMPLPLGDSDSVEVGDPVVAIGNPLVFTRTATAGIVSGLEGTVDPTGGGSTIAHAIETDAAINDGNSGGPLINAQGEVIGVNAPALTSTAMQGETSGLGFAIPIDTVKAVVAQLIRGRKVEHAYLGIGAVALTPSLARVLDLPTGAGLLVQDVAAGSGAGKAGLQAGSSEIVVAGESYRIGGDIIVTADGTPVATAAQLRDVLETLAPGDPLRLELWRHGRLVTVTVMLGQPPG